MIEAGLILEGGGMRGAYTAGVLDYFMEQKMQFAECYGVSAGSCHLCSYMSNQIGRALRISINYLDDKNYCSTHSLLTTGDLFNVEMCYDLIPNKLDLYDYKAANNYPGNCYAVATNLETGKAEYLPLKDMRKDIVAVQASSSLPLVSRNVEYNGKLYLDGGMADSIPIRHSIKAGNQKNVVILTRPVGYRKKPISPATLNMMKIRYHKYPRMVEVMRRRYQIYNKTLDFIEKAEARGKIFVLRPEVIVKIDRIEKDPNKLKVLYLQGYHDAAINRDAMMKYLEA